MLELLKRSHEGRAFLAVGVTAADAASLAAELVSLGASEVMPVSASRPAAGVVGLDLPFDDLAVGLDALRTCLAEGGAPRACLSWLAKHHENVWAVIPAATPALTSVWGIPCYGHRLSSWELFEDKTRVGAILSGVGALPGSSVVVPACASELDQASVRLDRGDGVVWARDALGGIQGYGQGLAWVRDGEDRARAAGEFERVANRVRVMPFIEGLPCSVSGFIAGERVAAVFEPAEILTVRANSMPYLRWIGHSTLWHPSRAARLDLQHAAIAIGSRLARHGVRGAYSVDGVLAVDGFVPTEVNVRYTGSLLRQARRLCLPIRALHHTVVAGEAPLELPAALRRALCDTRPAPPSAAGVVRLRSTRREEIALSWSGDAWARTAHPADGFIARSTDRDNWAWRLGAVPGLVGMPVASAICMALDEMADLLAVKRPHLAEATYWSAVCKGVPNARPTTG